MNIQIIIFIALLLGCIADAASTNSLIKRGGYEKMAVKLMGPRPKPATVWVVEGALPLLIAGVILFEVPSLMYGIAALAAWKLFLAYRNARIL